MFPFTKIFGVEFWGFFLYLLLVCQYTTFVLLQPFNVLRAYISRLAVEQNLRMKSGG